MMCRVIENNVRVDFDKPQLFTIIKRTPSVFINKLQCKDGLPAQWRLSNGKGSGGNHERDKISSVKRGPVVNYSWGRPGSNKSNVEEFLNDSSSRGALRSCVYRTRAA